MYKVFVADKLAPEGIAALEEYPDLQIDFSAGLSVDEAIPHVKDADAIIVRSATKLRGELLDAAKNVKVIGRAGIGVDNIDLEKNYRKRNCCFKHTRCKRDDYCGTCYCSHVLFKPQLTFC